MPIDVTEHLVRDAGRLAYRRTAPKRAGSEIVWLGGFHSDMLGEKASALHAAAAGAGRGFLRFDYSGHGESEGLFEDGTIGQWRADALEAISRLTEGPLVLCGSSMGGWMSILVAMAMPERVKGMLLLAPAPDFTDKLMWPQMADEAKAELLENGVWRRRSAYDAEGYPITRRLIEEGRNWNVLDAPIPFRGAVRILQGARDEDVPYEHSMRLVDRLEGEDVVWTLIKDGDHRLSRPQDIARLTATALDLADQVDGASA